MKFILLLLLTTACVIAQSSSDDKKLGTVIINISGFESSQGDIRIFLYNIPGAFPSKPEKALMKKIIKLKNKKIEVILDDVPYGVYAISAHHDENKNGIIDTNFLGIPNEALGSSNNPKGLMGPPEFDDAKFKLDKSQIQLKIKVSTIF
ncbi:DUF2141 domain-containing protein [Bacteroidota bacterium]